MLKYWWVLVELQRVLVRELSLMRIKRLLMGMLMSLVIILNMMMMEKCVLVKLIVIAVKDVIFAQLRCQAFEVDMFQMCLYL